MDEKLLLDRISNKDEKAFQQFVERYHRVVLNVCNNILHNYDDALDVSQEVFIKIYESIDLFRGDSKITTWLYRISVNKSLNFLRSKKKFRWFTSLDVLFKDDARSVEPIDLELRPGDQIELDENKKALHFALSKLPEKQNAAISLHNFEELSYKEIGEIMNISVTEVGVLINRGKKSLQKLILEYFKNN